MCADIFGGTQIPAWLVASTHEDSGGLGKSIGTIMAGGLLALQPNESGDGLKGLQQGLAEARMNQSDPMWRVKEKALEGQAVSTWANAATKWQQYDDTSRDMKLWMSDDLPALTKYQQDLKDDPDATAPVMKSTRGQSAINTIATQQLKKAQLNFKQDVAADTFELKSADIANRSVAAKAAVADAKLFNDTLETVINPTDRAGIRALTKAGIPTPESWAALASAPKKSKEDKKQEGAIAQIEARGGQARTTDAQRAGERTALETQKAQEKQDFEKTRQQNRVAIEDTKQKYKIDLEKLKLSDKGTGGKVITEDDYVNRHLTSVFNAMYKESSNPKQALADADRTLRARYQIDHEKKPDAAPAPASTAKDPLGLFGK